MTQSCYGALGKRMHSGEYLDFGNFTRATHGVRSARWMPWCMHVIGRRPIALGHIFYLKTHDNSING
jgi:hypothetical protein